MNQVLRQAITPTFFALSDLESRAEPANTVTFTGPQTDSNCGSTFSEVGDSKVSSSMTAVMVAPQNTKLFQPLQITFLQKDFRHLEDLLQSLVQGLDVFTPQASVAEV